jgi:tyrosyl-tRNA synthetase
MALSIKEKIELIKRNTCEIVKEEELEELLKKKKQPVVYHGFEPSGQGLHIGTMIGINKHIDFQKAGFKLKLLCADLHAFLNKKGSLSKIAHIAELYKAGFEALGVDVKKAEFVMGSDFQLGHEYFLDILKLSLKVRALRAKRAMAVIAREEEDPHVANMLYPLMQTADMKHLKVDIAFGDMAQRKIHMLARENLPGMEYKAPIAIHHDDMVGLTGGKMSSSVPNSLIMIDEEPESIKKKVNKAFCPEKKIEDNPILQICRYIVFHRKNKLDIKRPKKFGGNVVFKDYESLEKDFETGKLHPMDLKGAVADCLIEILDPVRKFMNKPKIVELKKLIQGMD